MYVLGILQKYLFHIMRSFVCYLPKGGADGVEQPDDEPADDLDPQPAGVVPAARAALRPPHARHRLPAVGARALHGARLPQAEARQHHAHASQLRGGRAGGQEVRLHSLFGGRFE